MFQLRAAAAGEWSPPGGAAAGPAPRRPAGGGVAGAGVLQQPVAPRQPGGSHGSATQRQTRPRTQQLSKQSHSNSDIRCKENNKYHKIHAQRLDRSIGFTRVLLLSMNY